MSNVELDVAGTVLIGWWILTGYLLVCLVPLIEPIERALFRGWRFVSIAWYLWRDAALRYDWRRALRAAMRHA